MPTALFAVWLLGQYLTPMQWASLPVLAVGVVLVTMNGSSGKHSWLRDSCNVHAQGMVTIWENNVPIKSRRSRLTTIYCILKHACLWQWLRYTASVL